MKRSLLFLILLAPALAGAADSPSAMGPNDLFAQANQLLEKGDTEKSQEIYQSLVRQGFESSELYYNLGNLAYRRGERGKAVLWYERALRLSPRDSDARFNLSLAQSHIKDTGESFSERLVTYFSTNELSWLLTLFIWVFFGLLGARLMGWIPAGAGADAGLWMTGLLLIFTGAWFGANIAIDREPQAVVVAPPGEVRNGPGTDYAVGFTVPEGSKVVILNRRPDWVQVGVPQQGLKGWMPADDVESISAQPLS